MIWYEAKYLDPFLFDPLFFLSFLLVFLMQWDSFPRVIVYLGAFASRYKHIYHFP